MKLSQKDSLAEKEAEKKLALRHKLEAAPMGDLQDFLEDYELTSPSTHEATVEYIHDLAFLGDQAAIDRGDASALPQGQGGSWRREIQEGYWSWT